MELNKITNVKHSFQLMWGHLQKSGFPLRLHLFFNFTFPFQLFCLSFCTWEVNGARGSKQDVYSSPASFSQYMAGKLSPVPSTVFFSFTGALNVIVNFQWFSHCVLPLERFRWPMQPPSCGVTTHHRCLSLWGKEDSTAACSPEDHISSQVILCHNLGLPRKNALSVLLKNCMRLVMILG